MCYHESIEEWFTKKEEYIKGDFKYANLPYVEDT